MKITDEGPWPHVQLGHSANMKPGDPCVVIGYPTSHPGRNRGLRKSKSFNRQGSCQRRDDWSARFWTSGGEPQLEGTAGGIRRRGLRPARPRRRGHPRRVGHDSQWRDARCRGHTPALSCFVAQWDLLAASKPVDVLDSDPLAEIAAAFRRIAEDSPAHRRGRARRREFANLGDRRWE